ncbi:hypothetical protein GN956_G12466 [Arapaima gigas]
MATNSPSIHPVSQSAVALVTTEPEPDVEPGVLWSFPELWDTGAPWSELEAKGKRCRAAGYNGKLLFLAGFLYIFICSLDVLNSAFQLVTGRNNVMS